MEQYELLWQYQQVDMELDQYEKEMRGNSNRKELLKHRDFLLEQQNVLKKIETDVEKVMKLIDSFDGVLPFTDKASPEVIRRELAMSKNEFKRAVGNLLKNGRIEITEKAIRRI